MRRFHLFLLTAAVLPAAAAAEAPDDTIVVTATRSEQPLSAIGQSISLLDQSAIDVRQTVSVVDLLRDLPGIAFARNGGPGALTSVFVRGANADQTIVLIDGVKLNDPSSTAGGFFFGDLLTGNIARVELLRGPQSVLWGSQSIGGVVNLITRAPGEAMRVNARAEYGWRDSAQIVGNVSGTAGPVAASVGGGYFRTDGISAFSGGSERDGYRNYGANAKLVVTLSDAVSLDLRGWYAEGRTEEDGFPAPFYVFADTPQYSRNRQFVGYGGINAALLDGRFRNRLAFAYTDVRRRSFAPDQQPSEQRDYRGRNERIEYQGIFEIDRGWEATLGAERETQRFAKDEVYDPTGRKGSARTDSLYGLLVASPLSGLTLTGGARHDDHQNFGGHTSLSASAAWSPGNGDTTIRAAYGEGFKAPSLYQLASEYGNPALNPETATGWETGITQRLLGGRAELGVTWFRRTTRNLIDYASCPGSPVCADGRSGYYKNINRALARGVEARLMLRPIERMTVEASYSHVRSEDRSPGSADFGKQLIRRPLDSLSVLADYRWANGVQTGATLRLVGERRDIDFDMWPAQDVKLDSYVLADLRVAWPLGDAVELYGRVENLFDERYETVLRYGTPGRAAYAGVRLSY